MKPLREKSVRLTAFLEFLLRDLSGVRIITPAEPVDRGCQLSIEIAGQGRQGRAVFEKLEARGVACDWREPNVIRMAPVPLYNSFEEVFRAAEILGESL